MEGGQPRGVGEAWAVEEGGEDGFQPRGVGVRDAGVDVREGSAGCVGGDGAELGWVRGVAVGGGYVQGGSDVCDAGAVEGVVGVDGEGGGGERGGGGAEGKGGVVGWGACVAHGVGC